MPQSRVVTVATDDRVVPDGATFRDVPVRNRWRPVSTPMPRRFALVAACRKDLQGQDRAQFSINLHRDPGGMSAMDRRHFFNRALSLSAAVTLGGSSWRPAPVFGEDQLREPVHRVANATRLESTPTVHPLDTALTIARDALVRSRREIRDYTALMVKREQIDGVVGELEYMSLKVRNRKLVDGQLQQPFSVYLGFLKPAAVKGRECIYVEGHNDGNVCAHEGGFKGRFLPTVNIPPTGMLAMRGQRYPITEVGLENLLLKLIERGGRARAVPDVQCEFRRNARVRDRVCTVIQVTQPTPAPGNEFHTAQIFMDDELQMPIRYIAYDYPRGGKTTGDVIEEYTYLNLKLNAGLTDADFDSNNNSYNFK